jgi:hypothetical protein
MKSNTAKKESSKAILSRVKKEMAKPRTAKSGSLEVWRRRMAREGLKQHEDQFPPG